MDWHLFSPVIIKDTDLPQEQERWLARSHDVLKDVHANRRKEWANGRVALAQALRARGVATDLLKCNFDGHQRVRELPEWRFSLSNTHGFAAALAVPAQGLNGVGLDIELSTRQVPEGVQYRAHNTYDVALPPLQSWATKEACYKSLHSSIQEQVWLNNIVLQDGIFHVDKLPHVRGHWRLRPHSSLTIVMAILT